ncbi:hypothetical protein K8I31_11565 [bacterium]|nr:hypothetical protein [bacterium]
MSSHELFGMFMSGVSLLVVIGILYLFVTFIAKLLSISPEGLIGFSCFAAVIVGMLSLFFGFVFCLNGEPVGGGACFIASALSFGLLSNALLRK